MGHFRLRGGSRPTDCLFRTKGIGESQQSLWLRHGEGYPKGMVMTWRLPGDGQTEAESRRKVDAATRCSGVCPTPDLDFSKGVLKYVTVSIITGFSLPTFPHFECPIFISTKSIQFQHCYSHFEIFVTITDSLSTISFFQSFRSEKSVD